MLNQLAAQEKELREKLEAVQKAITNEKRRIAEHEFGVRVGSIVKDRKGIEHRVTRVDVRYGGRPWLEGNPKKKDGTFGVANRNLYDGWTLVNS